MIKYIFVVPARTGSKGVPNKNFKPLAGKPLVDFTLELASDLDWEDKLVVMSSDNKGYESKCNSLKIYFDLRKPELSQDSIKIREVVLDFISRKVIDTCDLLSTWIVLLEPTTPLRTRESMKKLYEEIKANSYSSYVSVVKDNSISWCFNGIDYSREYTNSSQRQERPHKLREVGVFYACTVESFIKFGFISDQTKTIEVTKLESLDINDYEDWIIVESLIKNK